MHVYENTPEGIQPRHLVQAKNGNMRPTYVSDFRKWLAEGKLVAPSVTTILGILDKPALVNWKVDKHLEQAFACKIDNYDDYLTEVKRLTELSLDAAPRAGTDFHKILSDYQAGIFPDNPHERMCADNTYAVIEEFTGFKASHFQSEVSFCKPSYAGQADLISDNWVIDFKTKQEASKFKPGKMAYDEHRLQLAAYRMGLGKPNARCANVFICLEDGRVDFQEHLQLDLNKAELIFNHCVEIWHLKL